MKIRREDWTWALGWTVGFWVWWNVVGFALCALFWYHFSPWETPWWVEFVVGPITLIFCFPFALLFDQPMLSIPLTGLLWAVVVLLVLATHVKAMLKRNKEARQDHSPKRN